MPRSADSNKLYNPQLKDNEYLSMRVTATKGNLKSLEMHRESGAIYNGPDDDLMLELRVYLEEGEDYNIDLDSEAKIEFAKFVDRLGLKYWLKKIKKKIEAHSMNPIIEKILNQMKGKMDFMPDYTGGSKEIIIEERGEGITSFSIPYCLDDYERLERMLKRYEKDLGENIKSNIFTIEDTGYAFELIEYSEEALKKIKNEDEKNV